MELSLEHRRSLLTHLSNTKDELAIVKSLLTKKDSNEEINPNVYPLWEIDSFLLQKKIELIETSLIENDIDY